jgi:TonB-linked SusC/RagA family outer membrane protein
MFLLVKNKIRFFTLCFLCLSGLFSFSARAQNTITITGTVSDSEGPLPGVTVSVKGSATGTATDSDGAYSIQAPKGSTLVFSYVGMLKEEVSVGEKTRINITMREDAKVLEEVVVVGYGTIEKKYLTSAVTSLKAKDIVLGVGGATVGNSMKGKVSGLTMSGTDSPNTENKFQLRGMASVNSEKGPLVVIDGIAGADIRSIIPEDVQSMEFLKDAAAGAIYGTRASGGVILITTKKAKDGKVSISFTDELTYKQTFGKPEVLSAKEYLDYFPRVRDNGANTDWWDEALNPDKLSQRQILTLQGGSEFSRIYLSVMHDDNNGILRGDNRNDFGGRLNGSFKAVEGWVELNTDINYRQADRNESTPGMNNILVLDPTRPVYDPSNPTGYNIWTEGQNQSNTIGDAALNTSNKLEKWFRPSGELKLNILPVEGLSARVSVGYENRQYEQYKYESRFTTGQLRSGRKGSAESKFHKEDMFNTDSYLSFDRTFDDHSVNAVVGYSFYMRDMQEFELKNKDFPVDGVKGWDIGTGSDLPLGKANMHSHKDVTQKLAAVFSRINYNWKGKYIASVSVRQESSSKFAVNKRYGTFWQASVGWRISDEPFMKNLSWISDLKLRTAYGETGNEGFNATYAAIMYESDKYTNVDEATAHWIMPGSIGKDKWSVAYRQSGNYNPNLGWEEKHEWNIGLDYALLDNRLYGKIDYYRRNIVNLLYEATVPSPPYVVTRLMQNIGTLENKGLEIEIGGRPIRSKTWNYETSLNLSHNVTRVGKMANQNDKLTGGEIYPTQTHWLQVGTLVGSFHLYQHEGFKDNGDGTRDFVIKDLDGNPNENTDNDKVYTGNYVPALVCGWNHSLSYKNWQLYMTLTSWIDFDIFNAVEYYNGYAPPNPGQDQYNKLRTAFTKNGDIRPKGTYGYAPVSDYFLEDGTFLKIQNISLSYTFPLKKYVPGSVLDNMRFYLTVNNVYTFTKYSGHNPEVNITSWENGIEDHIYPQTRSYALGIQFNF